MRPLRITVVCALLGAGLASPQLRAAERLPTSPIWPTQADCEALAKAYSQVRHEAEQSMLDCYREPSQIGPGFEVSWRNSCSVQRGVRAYPQCVEEEQYVCQIGQKSISECQTCWERTKLRAAQVEKQASANSASITEAAKTSAATATKLTNDLYEGATSLTDKFDQARRLLTDPSKFLRDALLQKFRSRLAEFLNPEGDLRPDMYGDANEVYRYASNVKDAGLELTTDPIIHKFQQEALDEIVRHGAITRALVAQIGKEIENFTVRNSSLAPTAPVQASYFQIPITKTNCSVLKDPARSKRLLDQDQAGWLALVGECGN